MRYSIVGLCLILIFAGDGIKSANAETGASFGDCKTPSKNDGTCVFLSECTELYTILEKGSVTDEERSLLQASQCGYHDNKYLVCCPKMTVDDRFNPETNLLPQLPNCPYEFKVRIVGGHDTDFDEFPWLAMIEYTKPDKTKGFHCGGSLINNRYVLTAAHCVKGRIPEGWIPTSVRLGEWDTRQNPDCVYNEKGVKDCANNHEDIAIEKITTHPHYQPASRNQYHDIAVIRLSREIKTSPFIKPICLPQQSSLRDALYERLVLDVAGWGATETENNSNIKQTTNLTVWNTNDCRIKYSSQKIILGGGQMCAGGQEGVDSCSGDSGGPLFYKHIDGRPYYILAGVVSFGPKVCGQAGWPGVYTRVGQYLDWIRGNIAP